MIFQQRLPAVACCLLTRGPTVRRHGALGTRRAIRERVIAARERQRNRFKDTPITCNAEIPGSAVRTFCRLDTKAMELLAHASARRQFSARALDRIARAARMIADLAASESIEPAYVAEAIQYRSLERLDTRHTMLA